MTLLPTYHKAKEHFYNRPAYYLLLLSLVVAAFFRFYRLDVLPPGLHPDEAANGLDIIRMLEQGDFRVIYNTNGPRESLFFFLQMIGVLIFGYTQLALRVAPALVGVLSVYVTYLLTKEWFSRRTALIAAFLMAINSWTVIINRDGFRANLVILFIPLTLWAYTKAFRTKSLKWFGIAGASLGLGFYTYISFRAFIAVLIFSGLVAVIKNRKVVREYAKSVAFSLLVMLLILIPLGIHGISYPDEVLGARSSTSILNPDLNDGSPLKTLGLNIVKTALMFFYKGDQNFRHNLGGEPMLDPFTGISMLGGILYCLYNIKKSKYMILLAWFGALLLPVVLTAEGIPHGLRAVGVIPVVFILAGIGADYFVKKWYTSFPFNKFVRNAGIGLVMLLMLTGAILNYQRVFVAWAEAAQTRKAYAEDMVAVADYLKSNPDQNYVLVVGEYGEKTVQFLTHKSRVKYQRVEQRDIKKLSLAAGKYSFIIQDDWYDDAIKDLKQKYGQGRVSPRISEVSNDKLFYIYSGEVK